MKATIYCETTARGTHSFYLVTDERKFFLFMQSYRKGVNDYYRKGVRLGAAMSFSRTHGDNAIMRTMTKIPMYIRYVEKEFGIEVLEQTKKRNKRYSNCVAVRQAA